MPKSATPSPKDLLTTIFAQAAFVEEWEVETDMFIQALVSQIIGALVFYGWLRDTPKR